MPAKLLKGSEIREEILAEIKRDVEAIRAAHGVVPGLVTILVGSNPASLSYVALKIQTAHSVGFKEIQDDQPADISEEALLGLLDKYRRDDTIHGILVQLPLPPHINEKNVLNAIDPDKDVDGFHPVNVGKLMIGAADFLPCTPAGIQQMLMRTGVETSGAEVVVVGRSNIVGKPIANILLQKQKGANATVTICHTGSKDVAFHTRRADILIVAAGKPNAITADMVKEGAVVIDVGVNRIGMTAEGKARLCGDVDFASVKEKAGAITPVPGGVGPMTITMLMKNTVKAAKFAAGIKE